MLARKKKISGFGRTMHIWPLDSDRQVGSFFQLSKFCLRDRRKEKNKLDQQSSCKMD